MAIKKLTPEQMQEAVQKATNLANGPKTLTECANVDLVCIRIAKNKLANGNIGYKFYFADGTSTAVSAQGVVSAMDDYFESLEMSGISSDDLNAGEFKLQVHFYQKENKRNPEFPYWCVTLAPIFG